MNDSNGIVLPCDRVPVSAVLHTYNDARHLEECLKSIQWCDEIIVIDLGSRDSSREIATRYADRVLIHAWVPIADEIRPWSYGQAKYDWILCVDPDEVYPDDLVTSLKKKVDECSSSAAIIVVPIQYYFRGKPLECCMWYPNRRVPTLQNRTKVQETGRVHTSPLKDGALVEIPWGSVTPIKHYWKDTWGDFFRSHWRYIKLEGSSRFKNGKRFGLSIFFKQAWKIFILNFYHKDGWRGGVDGILLSLAMCAYETGAHISLFLYQVKLKFHQNVHD